MADGVSIFWLATRFRLGLAKNEILINIDGLSLFCCLLNSASAGYLILIAAASFSIS